MANGAAPGAPELQRGELPRWAEKRREAVKPISKNKKVEEEAKEAIIKFAEKEVAKEKKARDGEQPRRKIIHEAPPNVNYFPKETALPKDLLITEAISDFYFDANGKPLESLSKEVLIAHYLTLRKLAVEKGVDTKFLALFERALEQQEIDVEALVETSEDALYWMREVGGDEAKEAIRKRLRRIAGAQLDEGGVTDPRLSAIVRSTNRQMEFLLPGQEARKIEILEGALRDVRSIQGVDEGQRQTVVDRIVEEMGEPYRREQERQRRYQEERESRGSLYRERLITPDQRRTIEEDINRLVELAISRHDRLPDGYELKGNNIDSLFNRMFSWANAGLREDFHTAMGTIGNLEHQAFQLELAEIRDEAVRRSGENIDRHQNEIRAEIVQRFIEKYDIEYKMRELLHNAFYIADTGGSFEDFAKYCERFSSEYLDQAFLSAPEVEAALRVREQVLYQIRRENNGYIPPELVAYKARAGESEWDRRSIEAIKDLYSKGMFPNIGEKDQWKIDRAIAMSRGLGMVLLRFPEIIAEQPLGFPPSLNEAQSSIPWERLSWDLNPLDHKVKRYGIGKPLRAFLYATTKRTKEGAWSKRELEEAVAQDTITVLGSIGDDPRMVDMRNFFRTGGPFTHTGWRSYNASLNEYRDALRPLLERNPGLAMRMLSNRHDNLGQGTRRRAYYRTHQELDPQERSDTWRREARQFKSIDEEEWKEVEIASWKGAARRVPHVILRIITDEANGLMKREEREALYREILGTEYRGDAFTQVEKDLTVAKENLMRRRRDVIAEGGEAAWTEDQDQLIEADFNMIAENEGATPEEIASRRVNARRLHRIVVNRLNTDEGLMERIIKKVEDRMFSFAVTAEDVPWSEFHIGQTGGRGFVTRKINDAFAVAKAQDELVKLIKQMPMFGSPEDYVKQLRAIFDNAETYDWDGAQDAVKRLAIGLIRFHQKDGVLKIPIFGEITSVFNALRHQGNSFSEMTYGVKAPAWDDDDIYNFTEQLRQICTFEQVQDIRKETGGTFWRAFGKRTKLAFYLLLLFGFYEFNKRLIEEK